jgi:hypothetical protein
MSRRAAAAVVGGKIEIEIQTHRQFRRRGLARAVAARAHFARLDSKAGTGSFFTLSKRKGLPTRSSITAAAGSTPGFMH